ncbi:hypothetical protein JOC75_003156 [Metabacillus crassostreae]|uniref:hypothetical protein n=1 Tax=Metabacillus crassostreae TaxID=929098 RepID=UPI00195EABD4|nr:hypothetical protein [Metabacillus crassostreae]MBM7605133.1 hypothetical protein [Metabacillus crassostreae]
MKENLEMTTSYRWGAISLTVAGILFILYPFIRPFSDETSLLGASAFSSIEWLISHVMAILAFVLLGIGHLSFYLSVQNTMVEKLALRSLILAWIGIGLILPFYGAEVFSLNIIGQEAIHQQNVALMSLVNDIRFGPGFLMILIGLIILAASSILVAIIIWKSKILSKWSGIPYALGFILYLPQYMGTQPIRIVHGLVITIGCLWIALYLWRTKQSIDTVNGKSHSPTME